MRVTAIDGERAADDARALEVRPVPAAPRRGRPDYARPGFFGHDRAHPDG